MQTRHIGNNWVPLLGFAALFLAAGALSMVLESGNGADAGFLVVGMLLVAVPSAGWLWKNPSWWLAPRNHYLYLSAGTVAGMVLFSLIPFLNGTGPWLVLGAAIIVYGSFERFRLLLTTGAVVFATGFLAMLIHADVWGGALHLATTAVLAFAANNLFVLRNGRRRESLDSEPDFIGSFEEFDREEAQRASPFSREL